MIRKFRKTSLKFHNANIGVRFIDDWSRGLKILYENRHRLRKNNFLGQLVSILISRHLIKYLIKRKY